MADILHQFLDPALEIPAKPVKVLRTNARSVLVEHLGKGIASDARGLGHLLDGDPSPLGEFLVRDQGLELVAQHGHGLT